MITKIRKIGNSAGVILSKSILEQCSIKSEVLLEVSDNKIVISGVEKKPRAGWDKQFISAGSLEDNKVLIDNISNDFDNSEWTW